MVFCWEGWLQLVGSVQVVLFTFASSKRLDFAGVFRSGGWVLFRCGIGRSWSGVGFWERLEG